MKHEQLKKNAREAIDALTGDTSVPQSQTLADVEELISHLEIVEMALKEEAEDEE